MGYSLTVRQGITFIASWLLFVGVISSIVFLTGCATLAPWEQPTDHLDNPWPAVCRQNLAATVAPSRVKIHYRPREELWRALGRDADGLTWSFGVQGDEVIWIADDIVGWRKAAVLQHELCHLDEYGGVAWHA